MKKIRLAKTAGFCFGVKRALEIALATARRDPRCVMLGDIVHNEEVIRGVARAGIRRVHRLTRGRGRALLIRAHGMPRAARLKAESLGYRIVDATCPMVQEIHGIAADAERRGWPVIIIGDKEHDEVRGIVGQLRRPAIVIDSGIALPRARLRKLKKAAVVTQSTQNMEKVLALVRELKTLIPRIRFTNTICGPTRQKQNEIRSLPLANDAVVVIGSRSSANTRRLYEIAKSLNPRTFWIRSARDLRRKWFKGVRTVGVTAGASTPDATTKSVVRALRRF
ncbi:MAG: 4-hydroxy-3-methylbut-2-enyl diphosphate reductase [Deltaproteobacteria bacterium]